MSQASQKILLQSQLFGWFVLVFGFLGFFTWAALYPIDQGVPGSGFLVSETGKINVLSPSTGQVVKVNKKAGDYVVEGDVLFELDAKPLMATERGMKEAINGIQASSVSLRAAFESRQAQIQALRVQYDSTRQLVEQGFSSATSLAIIQSQLSLAESEALQLQSTIEQNRFRLRELTENLEGIRYDLSRAQVLAPASGVVMNTIIRSPGINITLGSQLMEIAPTQDSLLIEARVPVDFATRVHAGMEVDIMFPTLPGSSMLRIKGVLDYLAPDQIVDPKTGEVFLEGKVSFISTHETEFLGLRAGLPSTILINTGPRTLLSYITRPFLERLAKGLQ
jgi:multidrug resistance efflux pump